MRKLLLALLLISASVFGQNVDSSFYDNGILQSIQKNNYSDSIKGHYGGYQLNEWFLEEFNEEGKRIYFYLEDTLSRKVIAQKAFDNSGEILRYDMALDLKKNEGYERFYSPKGKLIWENQLSDEGYEGKVKLNDNLDLFDMKYSYYLSKIDVQPFFKTDDEYVMPYYIAEYSNGKKNGEFKSARGSKGVYSNNAKEGEWVDVYWTTGSEYRGWVSAYGNYENGLKTGVWVELSDKKDTLKLETFKNDTLNGISRNYLDGKYQQTIHYQNGKSYQPPNYTVNSKYEKGQYINYKKEGFWRFFYTDGEVHITFKDGEPVSPYVWLQKEYDRSKELDTIEITFLGSGSSYDYSSYYERYKDARNLKREGFCYFKFSGQKEYDTLLFQNDLLINNFIYYSNRERIKIELKEATKYTYYRDWFTIPDYSGKAEIIKLGDYKSFGELKNKKKSGLWKHYFKDQLLSKGKYKKDRKIGVWTSYRNELISDSIIYDDRENEIEKWTFTNGKISSGKRFQYDANNNKIKTDRYDISIGSFIPYIENQYNDQGELISLRIWNADLKSYQQITCDTSDYKNKEKIKNQANIVLPLRENTGFSGICFSDNGKYAFAHYNEINWGINYLVDIDKNLIIREFDHILDEADYAYRLSNSGRYLIALKQQSQILLVDLLNPKEVVFLDYRREFDANLNNNFCFSSNDSILYASTENQILIFDVPSGKKLNTISLSEDKFEINRIHNYQDSIMIVSDMEWKTRHYSLDDFKQIKEIDYALEEASGLFQNKYFLKLEREYNSNDFVFKFYNVLSEDSIIINPSKITNKWDKSSASFLSYSIDENRNRVYLWFDKAEKKYRKLGSGGQIGLIVWNYKLNKEEFVSSHFSFPVNTERFSEVNTSGDLFFLGAVPISKYASENDKMEVRLSLLNWKTKTFSQSIHKSKLLTSFELVSTGSNIMLLNETNTLNSSRVVTYEFDLAKGSLNFVDLNSGEVYWENENDENLILFQSKYDSLDIYFSEKGYYDTEQIPEEAEKLLRCQICTDLGIENTYEDLYLVSFKDNKVLLQNGLNSSIDHFNYNKSNKIERKVSLYIDGKGDFIFTTPDRYYFASEKARDLVYFEKDLKTYPFEQFDLKYNRPDIVLDRLGYADSSLVQAYYKAYQKRLKKMGFTEEMLKDDFHIPKLKIENFEEMPSIIGEDQIELNLKMKDELYDLDRINIWINDVAVYGSNGISLRKKNVNEYAQKIKLDLAKGKNKIQVSVLNQVGAESYKETIEIECTKGKSKPDLYLITIGESKFQQSEYNLTYASKDAKDIAEIFTKSKVFENVHTKTLVNEEVIKSNIHQLKTFLKEADINDEVMIFIAGHGVLDDELDYYFASYDMDFQNPSEKGIAYADLEALLDGIKPLKKTLLIDACHSGEIDKEEVELIANNTEEKGDIQFRAVGKKASPKLGIQNTSELTKSLFTDLRKGTGATVISSAGGMEFAMEGADWNNGLFTYCLLNGIRSKEADLNGDNEIWLSELQKYIQQKVFELSKGQQKPTSRIENQTVDFRVF